MKEQLSIQQLDEAFGASMRAAKLRWGVVPVKLSIIVTLQARRLRHHNTPFADTASAIKAARNELIAWNKTDDPTTQTFETSSTVGDIDSDEAIATSVAWSILSKRDALLEQKDGFLARNRDKKLTVAIAPITQQEYAAIF